MYPWRRFRSTQPSCVSGLETGVNCTSHLLRCERSNFEPLRKLSGRTPDVVAARSWPGTTTLPAGEEASFFNVIARQTGLHTPWKSSRSSNEIVHPSASTHSNSPPRIRAPPRCRLPISMRFTALLLYVTVTLFLISTTCAIPLSASHAHIHLQHRQSIPDRFGNTGNDPAPVKSQPPPFPPTPTPSATVSAFTSSTLSSSATQPTTTLTTSPNGNSNNDDSGSGLGPKPGSGPPAEELRLTSPKLGISIGALAGIISGGVAFLIIVIGLGVFFYRRTRTPEINEIPIRRSKLGSRLGRRMFGSPSSSNSRSNSRSSSRASLTGDAREKQAEAPGRLDKGMIGRPKAAWLENGFLSVPKPAFMREEKEKAEDGEKWVDKGAISGPRPGRPASAEPLGRLSGMGMGMGYLK